MNGKRAKALRKVALGMACEMIPQDPSGAIPNLRYVPQDHIRYGVVTGKPTQRLGPCIRKVEKEAKREFNNLTR